METAREKQKESSLEPAPEEQRRRPGANIAPDSGHGGDVYRISDETGIPVEALLDFSSSINPLGISGGVKELINMELDKLVNYPDRDTKELRQRIGQYHGVDPDSVVCGNGSTELIYLIPRALNPDNVLIPAPTFSEYERACRLSQESRIMSYELRKDKKFSINADEFISFIGNKTNSKLDMAFLCNPNNPTGSLLHREEVLKIADAARGEGCLLVVDEAFIDFCPEHSVINDVQDNPCLAVLRSLTKFYALTGLRLGYGVFHEDIIKKVKRYKEPWTVNTLAQAAGAAALADKGYADETHCLIRREKEFLEMRFREEGLRYFPSAANYYLLEMLNAGAVAQGLRKKGILVRDCSNFRGLDRSYIRVAVKSREDNEMLVKEIAELCRA